MSSGPAKITVRTLTWLDSIDIHVCYWIRSEARDRGRRERVSPGSVRLAATYVQSVTLCTHVHMYNVRFDLLYVDIVAGG